MGPQMEPSRPSAAAKPMSNIEYRMSNAEVKNAASKTPRLEKAVEERVEPPGGIAALADVCGVRCVDVFGKIVCGTGILPVGGITG